MARPNRTVRDVKQSTFRTQNGHTMNTCMTRGQTDLLLAELVSRYLAAVTPREETEAVTQLFAGELH